MLASLPAVLDAACCELCGLIAGIIGVDEGTEFAEPEEAVAVPVAQPLPLLLLPLLLTIPELLPILILMLPLLLLLLTIAWLLLLTNCEVISVGCSLTTRTGEPPFPVRAEMDEKTKAEHETVTVLRHFY